MIVGAKSPDTPPPEFDEDVVNGFAGFGIHEGLAIIAILGVEDDGDGFRCFSLCLLLLLIFFVCREHDLQGLRFDHGGTEHEEGNQKHVHVNHRGKVDMDLHLLLGAFLFLAAFV